MELPDRDERDEEAGAIMALVLIGMRRELTSRWNNGRKPPDDSFWSALSRDLGERMGVILFGTFLASVRFHSGGNDLDGTAMDAGIPWSADRARYFAGLIANTTRTWIAELMADIATGNLTDSEIQARLDRIFGETRARIIASDLVTTGQTYGGEFAHRLMGTISPQDIWRTHPELTATGPCPICAPLDGTPRSEWELVAPHGPPLHPTCPCEIIYAATISE